MVKNRVPTMRVSLVWNHDQDLSGDLNRSQILPLSDEDITDFSMLRLPEGRAEGLPFIFAT